MGGAKAWNVGPNQLRDPHLWSTGRSRVRSTYLGVRTVGPSRRPMAPLEKRGESQAADRGHRTGAAKLLRLFLLDTTQDSPVQVKLDAVPTDEGGCAGIAGPVVVRTAGQNRGCYSGSRSRIAAAVTSRNKTPRLCKGGRALLLLRAIAFNMLLTQARASQKTALIICRFTQLPIPSSTSPSLPPPARRRGPRPPIRLVGHQRTAREKPKSRNTSTVVYTLDVPWKRVSSHPPRCVFRPSMPRPPGVPVMRYE